MTDEQPLDINLNNNHDLGNVMMGAVVAYSRVALSAAKPTLYAGKFFLVRGHQQGLATAKHKKTAAKC